MPKKKQKTKKRFSARTIWLTAIIGGASIFIISNLIYSAITQKRLENNFSKTEKDIELLKAAIEQKTPGVTLKKETFCDHSSMVWSKGPLHCDIVLETNSHASMQQTVDALRVFEKNESWTLHNMINIKESPFSTSEYKNKKTGLKCNLNFKEEQNNIEFSFKLYCSKPSKRAFYPYKN